MLQAPDKCQLWSAHTPMPAFAETSYHGGGCGWTQVWVDAVLCWGSCFDEQEEFRLRNLMLCPEGFGNITQFTIHRFFQGWFTPGYGSINMALVCFCWNRVILC